MTEEERRRAVSYLRETRALVSEQTGALTEAQWRFKPSPERWSPAECLAHVTISEENLLGILESLGHAPEPAAELLAQTAGRDDLLLRMIRSRKGKAQAPEEQHPPAEAADPANVLQYFCDVRDRTIRYLETTSDPLRARVHSHFILGPFDGYQWVLFLGAHTERHLKQIQESKNHPDFPAKKS